VAAKQAAATSITIRDIRTASLHVRAYDDWVVESSLRARSQTKLMNAEDAAANGRRPCFKGRSCIWRSRLNSNIAA
jgi:hypothetical protein